MARRTAPRAQPGSQTEQVYSMRDDRMAESSKIYRDAFCVEYIKDFSGSKALVRIGYEDKRTLSARASGLLREPYVANKIDQLVRQLKPEDIVTRQQVMALMWKEANDPYNEGGVRVAACAHVAKMLGMFKEAEVETTAPVGVMMIPVMSVADWETSAVTAQAFLKREANAAPTSMPCPPPQQPTHGQS